MKSLNGHAQLSHSPLDRITAEKITAFVTERRKAGLAVSTINRQLEVLRRMLRLAMEWGKVDKMLAKVEMLPGEKHRDRVLTADEMSRYLDAAVAIGNGIQKSYLRALTGIRATKRGEDPIPPTDPFLLRDVATVLMDCGLRPDECFRLRWEHVRDRSMHVPFGKTENARRTIPLPPRTEATLQWRRQEARSEWVFSAATATGHVEKSTLRKQHKKACAMAQISPFPLYTFRHTCLTH